MTGAYTNVLKCVCELEQLVAIHSFRNSFRGFNANFSSLESVGIDIHYRNDQALRSDHVS